jgi:hypothetical protein
MEPFRAADKKTPDWVNAASETGVTEHRTFDTG